jgi:hypothetical protein
MKFEAKLLSPLRAKSVRFQLKILDLSHDEEKPSFLRTSQEQDR